MNDEQFLKILIEELAEKTGRSSEDILNEAEGETKKSRGLLSLQGAIYNLRRKEGLGVSYDDDDDEDDEEMEELKEKVEKLEKREKEREKEEKKPYILGASGNNWSGKKK